MDEALNVIAIIALTSITVFVVFGIVFLSKTIKILSNSSRNIDKITENFTVVKTRLMISLEEISETRKDIKELKEKSLEHLDQWKETSTKANLLIDNVNNGVDNVIESIEPYERLINRSYNKIAPPIDKATSIVSALTKAIEAFGSRLKSKT